MDDFDSWLTPADYADIWIAGIIAVVAVAIVAFLVWRVLT